jgi:predicted ATPase/DNA-binding SARP family transcriptional activator
MQLRILGPLELTDGDRLIAPGGAKQRAVLAVLVLRLGEVVTSERLIEDVWEGAAPSTAAKSVQVYVSGLRRALDEAGAGGALVTRPGGYALELDRERVDAYRFERLLGEARGAEAERAAELLREALALWRGPPLLDFTYQAFAQGEIARLEELRLTALEARIEADLKLGQYADVVGELEWLVAAHPARERLAGQLMVALYHCGRQAQALDVYQRIRAHLDDELGLEAGPELKALQTDVLNQSLTSEAPVSRVPVPPTPTIGRADDLDRLAAELAPGRLVTVIGPGGMGKTRLALEAGRRRRNAVFVALAPVAEAEHVAAAIAAALELAPAPGGPLEDQLARHLATRELLLILDNFEHVLDAAVLVADLLAAAPRLTVLATSREPLRIRAERTFALGPLESEAVELFVQVARARDAAFDPTVEELAAIGRLCRRLDGLPLAIELAAGRVGLLSPQELSARLDEGLDVLADGPRDVPARHRALRATLSWSYDLLEPSERAAFARLGVFAGGATVGTARAVSGVSLDVLEALCDKQLLVHGEGRIGMLETIRTFARERLAERPDAEAIARAHATHYLAFAEDLAQPLRRTSSPALLDRFAPEIGNVRVALTWAIGASEAETAQRLAAAFDAYLVLRDPAEGEQWLSAALALAGAAPAVRAAALHRYAYQLNFRGAYAAAEVAAHEGFDLSASIDDARGRALSLVDRTYSLMARDRGAEGVEVCLQAIEWARRAADDQALADAYLALASTSAALDDVVAAAAEAETLYTRLGNAWMAGELQVQVGYRALLAGDDEVAAQALARARGSAEAAGAAGEQRLAFVDGSSGLLAIFHGDYDEAASRFVAQLQGARTLGMGHCLHEGLVGIAAVLAATGEDVAAARLCGAADTFADDPRNGAIRPDGMIERRLDAIFAAARARAGEDFWDGARGAGACLDAAAAVELALASAPASSAGASR